MKARNRKTGKIVDITSYNDISTASASRYLVSYTNSVGMAYTEEGANFYSDFEFVRDTQDEDVHWQDVRERAAIAAMQGLFANPVLIGEYVATLRPKISIVETAIEHANMLVERLKKEQGE